MISGWVSGVYDDLLVILVLSKQVRAPVSEVEEGEDDRENDARHDVNALGARWELLCQKENRIKSMFATDEEEEAYLWDPRPPAIVGTVMTAPTDSQVELIAFVDGHGAFASKARQRFLRILNNSTRYAHSICCHL